MIQTERRRRRVEQSEPAAKLRFLQQLLFFKKMLPVYEVYRQGF